MSTTTHVPAQPVARAGAPAAVREVPGRRTVAIGAGALGLVAYPVLVGGYLSPAASAFVVVVCWAICLGGLLEWRRDPQNPIGALLCAYGCFALVSAFQATSAAWPFTLGYAVSVLPPLLLARLMLSYPTGRLDHLGRKAMILGYVAAALPPLALLVYDPAQHMYGINDCRIATEDCPQSAIVVWRAPGVYNAIFVTQLALYSLAAIVFVALIARRARAAPRRWRWLAYGLVAAAVLAAGRVVMANVLYASRDARDVDEQLFWTSAVAQGAVAVVLVVGLVRRRLARAAVASLVLEMERMPPADLRHAIARSVGDPSLELAFWLPDRQVFVDGDGRPTEVPEDGLERGVTKLERDGQLLGVVLHDPSLHDEADLATAGAATRLALENARLQAEVLAQVTEVRQSRARIVEAADAERRRLERDIHDGAQQRLVALALKLRVAERRLERSADPEVDAVLRAAVDELQHAVNELRELARGVYPAILTDEGLGPALRSLVSRTPLPVEFRRLPEGRAPAGVEATAYFVVSEALANAVKHSEATRITVDAWQRSNVLRVEVADDGRGGARMSRDSGLSGLVDRVAAQGGTLTISSPQGEGTTIVAEIPCER